MSVCVYHCKLITGNTNCIQWRQTGGCDPDGKREPTEDKGCHETIEDGWSGYCECRDESKAMRKGCEKGDYRTCEIACGSGKTKSIV